MTLKLNRNAPFNSAKCRNVEKAQPENEVVIKKNGVSDEAESTRNEEKTEHLYAQIRLFRKNVEELKKTTLFTETYYQVDIRLCERKRSPKR